jgi:GNAT superfamily N-acetyltransferase
MYKLGHYSFLSRKYQPEHDASLVKLFSVVTTRLITDPADPAIVAFGRVQNSSYSEPENLIPVSFLPRMIQWRDESRANFLLVAEENGVVLGGSVFHFMTAPNTGFSSFMAVTREARGRGIARALHEARFRALDDTAQALEKPVVDGVFIDVMNPERMSAKEFDLEQSVGSDPFTRLKIFGKFGFRRVDIAYQQPTGGPNGGPITNLDLLYCPHPGTDTQSVPLEKILGTMRAYWSAWLNEDRINTALERLRKLSPGSDVPLVPPEGD